MTWHMLWWEENDDGWMKPHIVPYDLVDEIVGDITSRGFVRSKTKTSDRTCFGVTTGVVRLSWIKDTVEVNLNGKIIDVQKFEAAFLYDALQSALKKPRGQENKYIKLHGPYSCLCLSIDDAEILLEACEKIDANWISHKEVGS